MTLPILKFSRAREQAFTLEQALESGVAAKEIGRDLRRDAILSRLGDLDREILGTEMAEILDEYRHDAGIHRALIARRRLPATVTERLVRLVASTVDLDALLRRHPVPGSLSADPRSVRPRPAWWRGR